MFLVDLTIYLIQAEDNAQFNDSTLLNFSEFGCPEPAWGPADQERPVWELWTESDLMNEKWRCLPPPGNAATDGKLWVTQPGGAPARSSTGPCCSESAENIWEPLNQSESSWLNQSEVRESPEVCWEWWRWWELCGCNDEHVGVFPLSPPIKCCS